MTIVIHETAIIHKALRKKGSLRWDIAFMMKDHNSPVWFDPLPGNSVQKSCRRVGARRRSSPNRAARQAICLRPFDVSHLMVRT